MNQSECIDEVSRLIAAFPSTKATDSTASVYVEALVGLQYPKALHEAVDALIAGERWLPTVSLVRETYRAVVERHRPRALPEAPISEEQRVENVARFKAMTAHLAARDTEGHTNGFDACEHPDCVAVRTEE